MKYGRYAIAEKELALLRHMVEGAQRHCEIGTLWGGSAIAVALHNPKLHVWCIDPLNGYYGRPDPYANDETPNSYMVRENFIEAGVYDRITMVLLKSQPFPLEMKFDTGLIDGDHSPDTVLADWLALKERCDMVAFHDIDDPNIAKVIEQHVKTAEGWVLVESTERLAVYARV